MIDHIKLALFTRKRLGKKASPLVEEAILIGIAFFSFLLLFGAIAVILDWFLQNSEKILSEIVSGFLM
ncbi:MAG: hypothetical protein ACXAEU_05140 [Candidatus Hodarchaeales archaeon]|jgi:hypothetical protein